ncbi:hypothetical protein EV421DRAFT_1744475 [Armillaria borealis]|uniref:Acid protease n=1 Tax=Armillaria borealis TaxID=47425 RepID=A0AA39IUR7_9AGAR|nr:hypothetical protein EV421DRAFT_1744475 [Armillaria borealis]
MSSQDRLPNEILTYAKQWECLTSANSSNFLSNYLGAEPSSSALKPAITLVFEAQKNQPDSFSGFDGILGQRSITGDTVSMYFAPTMQEKIVIGELSCDGSDSSKITGSYGYVYGLHLRWDLSLHVEYLYNRPITTTYPAGVHWGIDKSITYGTSTTILSSTAGIINTGSTLVYNASNAFTKYKSTTGETFTGLLRIIQPSTPSFPISPSRSLVTSRFYFQRFEAVQGPRQIAVLPASTQLLQTNQRKARVHCDLLAQDKNPRAKCSESKSWPIHRAHAICPIEMDSGLILQSPTSIVPCSWLAHFRTCDPCITKNTLNFERCGGSATGSRVQNMSEWFPRLVVTTSNGTDGLILGGSG